jgi:hypothetical protein
MGAWLSGAYGLVCYVLFLGTFLYAVGFVDDLGVPKSVDSGTTASLAAALIVNTLLLSLFAIQHSVMARQGFKRWWTRFVPMNAFKTLFAATCLAACATPALSQVISAVAAGAPPPTVPNCGAHPEARATGCSVWSDWLEAYPVPVSSVTCTVLNVHPTKSISGTFEIFHINKDHAIPLGSGTFGQVLPGLLTAISSVDPSDSVYCRVTLTVTGPHEHADERQVRATMKLVGPGGIFVSSSTLR